MKSVISVLALAFVLAFPKASKATVFTVKNELGKPLPQHIHLSKNPLEMYFWIFYGPCLQLVRLNPPGYTDAQGNYWANASLTFMTSLNYFGTTQICPPEGEVYC